MVRVLRENGAVMLSLSVAEVFPHLCWHNCDCNREHSRKSCDREVIRSMKRRPDKVLVANACHVDVIETELRMTVTN